MENVLYEGAEAKILKIDNNSIKKIRLEKSYRHKDLDQKLRKQRARREFKVLTKLYENKVNIPKPISIDEKELSIDIEYLDGQVLKETIDDKKLKLVFDEIKKMHDLGISHGDLTTLNMIDTKDKIYIIDFGLAQFSDKAEERAVDLHMFWNCIKNEHNKLYKFREELLKKYDKLTLEKLEKLEKRGRNK